MTEPFFLTQDEVWRCQVRFVMNCQTVLKYVRQKQEVTTTSFTRLAASKSRDQHFAFAAAADHQSLPETKCGSFEEVSEVVCRVMRGISG